MSAPARKQAEETLPLGQAAEDVVGPTLSTEVGWGYFPPTEVWDQSFTEKHQQVLSLLVAPEPHLTPCLPW